MLTVHTISDWFRLPGSTQTAILKNLRTKTRLEDWLRSLNDKKKRMFTKPFYMKCKECGGKGKFWVEPRDSSDIHPSQITKCSQKLWFDCSAVEMDWPTEFDENGNPTKTERMLVPYYKIAEEYIEPKLRMIFDLGHGVHDMFQKYGMRGAWGDKRAYFPEFPIDPDKKNQQGDTLLPNAEAFWIKGSVDALLHPYIIHVPGIGDVSLRVIHEYKSINDNGYSRLNSPKADHKWQATIYSKVLNVPIVVYIYLNKNNSFMADFPVPFDPGLWNAIEDKIDAVQRNVEAGTRFPWEETSAVLNPRDCTECGYHKICNPPAPTKKTRSRR